MLRPMEQWICDTCGGVIESAKHGYLEWWITGDGQRLAYDFRFVHVGPDARCSRRERAHDGAIPHDLPLGTVVGDHTVPFLLAFIDPAAPAVGTNTRPRVRDLPEWVELARRLTIPYYEEARQYWRAAHEAGLFEDASEVSPYLPETLRSIVEEFRAA